MCWLRSTSQQPWKAWQLQSYFAGEKAESQSHTGQWVCPELAVLGPWVCNAANRSHLERLRLRDEASFGPSLCYGRIQSRAPAPGSGTAHCPPLPTPQNWPWPHLLPDPAALFPPQPPALSIARPWRPVSHGFSLSQCSWPVMAMKCSLLVLGSSSLEGGMGPV